MNCPIQIGFKGLLYILWSEYRNWFIGYSCQITSHGVYFKNEHDDWFVEAYFIRPFYKMMLHRHISLKDLESVVSRSFVLDDFFGLAKCFSFSKVFIKKKFILLPSSIKIVSNYYF